MSVLVPDSAVTGRALFENTSTFRARDDQSDRKSGVTYQHSNFEFSATEANEWVGFWQYLVGVVKSGVALAVRNTTGVTIAAGPVYVSGYDITNDVWLISMADADGALPAEMLLLTSLANNTSGTAYLAGVWTSTINTTAAAIGDPVYLSPTAGAGTLTAPTGADQIKQIIGRVKTLAASGVINGGVKAPTKVGTSWLQNSAIDLAAATKITGILGSANGGTGNGFTKFSGPAASEKTKTLSNASDTIAECGQANTFTAAQIIRGNLTLKDTAGTGAGALKLQDTTGGQVVTVATASNEAADRALTIPPLGADKFIAAVANSSGLVNVASEVTGIMGSANGGTGNGFAKLSGPATSEKTYTLPNATCSILTDNAVVTAAQGGTGNNNAVTSGNVLVADGAKFASVATSGDVTTASGGATTIGARKVLTTHLASATVDNRLCEGRLTLDSADPCKDVTTGTTLYFLPYIGNRIATYDGTNWNLSNFGTGKNISLASLAGGVYDVFIVDGTLALELLVWTNSTTRATAIVLQDGVYVKSGATTRRLLGTIRVNASVGSVDDNTTNRSVWNVCNRIRRALKVTDATDSWTYTTATWRAANNNTGNSVTYVIGTVTGMVEDSVRCSVQGLAANSAGVVAVPVGIGVDSSTVNSAQLFGGGTQVATISISLRAEYVGVPTGIGLHTLYWLEQSQASGTTTWFGDAGSTLYQSGLVAEVMA